MPAYALWLALGLQAALGQQTFHLVSEGTLPSTRGEGRQHVGDLYGEGKDCFVVADPPRLLIMDFDGKNWQLRDSLPFDTTGQAWSNSTWTIGFPDDAGQDEIVVVSGRTLVSWRWNGSGFGRVERRLPWGVDDMISGDLNDDGSPELVMLTYSQPLPDSLDQIGRPYNLVVAGLEQDSIRQFWNDHGRLKLWQIGFVPSDHLVCIADVQGTGHAQVLCAAGQSDISATLYYVLDCQGDSLVRIGEFTVTGNKLNLHPHELDDFDPYTGSLEEDWVPVLVGEEQAFVAWEFGRGDVIAKVAEAGSAFWIPWTAITCGPSGPTLTAKAKAF